MTQSAVAQNVGVSRSTIAQMELGNRTVSSLELDRLADLFGRDVETFLEESSGGEEAMAALLRALPGIAQEDSAIATVRRCLALGRERTKLERQLDIYREHVSAVAYQVRPPRTRWEAIQQGEMVAEEERRRLALGTSPIADLVGLLEWQGVRVAFVGLPDDVAGLTLHEKDVGFLAVVNGTHSPLRRRFSLAHEHGHILIDREQLGTVSRASKREELVEFRANVFAASFLVPKDGVLHFIESLGKGRPSRSHAEVYDESGETSRVLARAAPGSQTPQLIEVVLLAHHFGVSHWAALYRLYNAKLLSETDMRHLEAQLKGGKGDAMATALALPAFDQAEAEQAFRRRFLRLALEALRRGAICEERFFELARMVELADDAARLIIENAGFSD